MNMRTEDLVRLMTQERLAEEGAAWQDRQSRNAEQEEGTKVAEGKAILNASGLNVIAADDLDDAAQKIVTAVKG